MPELPDLQAFSRNLTRKLAGKKLEKIHAIYRKKLRIPEKELQQALEGAQLSTIYRDGKELHFGFDNGNTLSLHLMLKGQLQLFQDKNENKFTIVELLFSDGTGLALTDWQRQATPALNPPAREAPDALSKKVNLKFLRETLGASKASIKKLLMDQDVIRGIGNAYADEILWQARISPFSISSNIPDTAVKVLAKSIRQVLTRAEKTILKNDPEIISGEIRDFLSIHNAKRERSPGGAKILVDETGGRKTYYTDEQKLFR